MKRLNLVKQIDSFENIISYYFEKTTKTKMRNQREAFNFLASSNYQNGSKTHISQIPKPKWIRKPEMGSSCELSHGLSRCISTLIEGHHPQANLSGGITKHLINSFCKAMPLFYSLTFVVIQQHPRKDQSWPAITTADPPR